MRPRIATGMVSGDGPDAFAEAASRAALGLGGAPVDLALVFAGPEGLDEAETGLAAVRARLRPRALAGCGAVGVVGGGRELESGGVTVWAASLPGAAIETAHLDAVSAGPEAIAVRGMPDLDDAEALILLVDPYTFPAEPLLARFGDERPGLSVVGGLSGAGSGPGTGALFVDDGVEHSGAIAIALSGVDMRTCVSQGARPVGAEMVVTAAEGNVVLELASKPALDRLKQAIAELEPRERLMAANGLLLGIVVNENQPDYERGDFLVRGLLGVDEERGAVVVGEAVRVGQTMRMQVRDGTSADEDLREVLARELAGVPTPPAGALLFTCAGRGAQMFGSPDHDASEVERALAGAPTGGLFCAGEIGPIGGRPFVHGFTATLAVFCG